MGIVAQPETAMGRELAKFEQHRTDYTSNAVPPGNPYAFRKFGQSGKMIYKAQYHPTMKRMECMVAAPDPVNYERHNDYQRDDTFVARFNLSCYRIVHTDDELRVAMNDGWCESPKDALAEYERGRKATADITAERHFTDKRMSPRAQAEAAAADEADGEHVASVPAPKKRRGRKPNAPMVTVPELPVTE